ncbi:MAG: folylpolyglutamate synthase/dihydrofolate synthase family protein [Chloroflexota bacterium]
MSQNKPYLQALDYLYSFMDFSLTHQEQIAPERFELERMVILLEKLGSPHKSYETIHIAGTKGKGSVAAHCEAALRKGGYTTGLYTSPHLTDFRERIQLNGELIPESEFVRLVEKLKPVVETIPGLTSYELQTALAMLFFAEAQVQVAVLEVGMGGRLDSTNVVIPLVSVISSISYDHTFILGETLTEIAGEKGGIIKPGIPVVSAPQDPEALQVLKKITEDNAAELILVGDDWKFKSVSHDLEGQVFEVQHGGKTSQYKTRLLGSHQLENAVTALVALKTARLSGLAIEDQAIKGGFEQVSWPGRFEVVAQQPAVVFDGAHNRDSAQRLMETVTEYFPDSPVSLVFGAMEDKDIPGMFAELLPGCSHLILSAANHPRAAKPTALAELAATYTIPVEIVENQEQVIPRTLVLTGKDGVVLFTGSLSVVGDFRSLWYQKLNEDGYN